MDLNFTSPEEQYGDDGQLTYAAWMAEQERLCPATFITGPQHDPYGTDCDLPRGHYPATPHVGADPFGGDGFIEWRGGGSVAGDPLPYTDVVRIDADGTRTDDRTGRRLPQRARTRASDARARTCSWSVSDTDVEREDIPPDFTAGDHSLSSDGPRCGAERTEDLSGSYWYCTRLPGHTGRHAAGNGMHVLAVWI